MKPYSPPTHKFELTPAQRQNILRVLLLILILALTAYIFTIRDRVSELGAFGYPGIFLVSLITNASLIIPVPGVMITSAMGAVFNPFWVAIAAGLGAALGEMSGYLAGYGGQVIIPSDSPRYQTLIGWMKKYGIWTILFLSFIPNPAFDVAGIIAGALKMPISRFLFVCAIGKILKMLVFAYFGAGIMSWLRL